MPLVNIRDKKGLINSKDTHGQMFSTNLQLLQNPQFSQLNQKRKMSIKPITPFSLQVHRGRDKGC